MGFGSFLKGALKQATKVGYVNSHDFPQGTYINFGSDAGEKIMLFTLPNKEEVKITHDMIESATVLAMGVIEIKQDNKGTTLLYGTKYFVKLKDGRAAVLTVGLGDTLYRVESIIF